MQVRVLGAHNLETKHTKHTCFLVDGRVAVDAGSLVTSLTAEEQAGIKSILLTHQHFDHVRDLPTLGLATMETGGPISVFGLPETLEMVTPRLMDGVLYPDFTNRLTAEGPKYSFHMITPGEMFETASYSVRSVRVPHSAPCVGYVITGLEGRSFAYCGDCGGGLLPFMQDQAKPSVLFIEVTFADRMIDRAKSSGHLTPGLLGAEIAGAMKHGLAIPRIMVVHRDASHEAEIEEELKGVSAELGVEIILGQEDMLVEV